MEGTIRSPSVWSLSLEVVPLAIVVVEKCARPFEEMNGGNFSALVLHLLGVVVASLLVEIPAIDEVEKARTVDIDMNPIIRLVNPIVVVPVAIIVINNIICVNDVFLLAVFRSRESRCGLCGIVAISDEAYSGNDEGWVVRSEIYFTNF